MKFTAIGENIHCTRSRKTTGKFVSADASGKASVLFGNGSGGAAALPVPDHITGGDEWKNGKVRHVAVAVFQGLHGDNAARENAAECIRAMAREQELSGASFLDVNVDEFSTDIEEKTAAMRWVVAKAQEGSRLPVSIDSSNASIAEAGLRACAAGRGKPLLNSVSLEREQMIPLAAEHHAKVIAGASGRSSMPDSVEGRMANIAELLGILRGNGFNDDDIFIDPLVMPVSVDVTNGLKIIDTVCAVRKEYGNAIHFAPGISNVSFGMPKRSLINFRFAWLCMRHGCDGGIVDPLQINEKLLAEAVDSPAGKLAQDLLCGLDEFGMEFITAVREGAI